MKLFSIFLVLILTNTTLSGCASIDIGQAVGSETISESEIEQSAGSETTSESEIVQPAGAETTSESEIEQPAPTEELKISIQTTTVEKGSLEQSGEFIGTIMPSKVANIILPVIGIVEK
ncbi:hypothetical protein AN643_03635 [Candidatus Epulonipiscioides saccharophilum]|nr:hypothetical protein AN643_03635 [Epulopiscium sp. SCG-B10WGA-EpuloB]